MITNPRIEKKKADIARTEIKFAEVRARLRTQKQDLINLENEEIVAMFRKEVITEDDFATLLHSRQEMAEELNNDGKENYLTRNNKNEGEENTDELDKN